MANDTPVTQTALAKIAGISQPAISRHIARGTIPTSAIVIVRDDQGRPVRRILPGPAIEALERNRNSPRRGRPMVHAELHALNLEVQTKLQALETKMATLMDRHEVQCMAFERARRFRDAILEIPDKLAAVVSAERNQEVVRKLVADAIERALSILEETL